MIPCKILVYPGAMADARRKQAGKRIQRARRAAGYRSQKAFADAIGVHESSVAQAESGSERPGEAVFTAIEVGLGLPEEVIMKYISSGDEALLMQIVYQPNRLPPSQKSDLPEDELELMSALSKLDFSAEEIVQIVRQRRARIQSQSEMDVGQAGENGA